MNNIKQALESAIEALEASPVIDKYGALKIPAINQCKSVLAEIENSETVAWRDPTNVSPEQGCTYLKYKHEQWVGMSDEQNNILIQAITDPENQPSQFGTVPLEWYENLENKHERMLVKVNEVIDSLCGSYEKHAIRKALQEAINE